MVRSAASPPARVAADAGRAGPAPQPREGAVWIHCGPDVSMEALAELAARLSETAPALTLTLTHPPDCADVGAAAAALPAGVELGAVAMDARAEIEALVGPQTVAAVMSGGALSPLALAICRQAGVPVVLLEGRLLERRGLSSYLPDWRERGRLRSLSHVLAADRREADQFVRMGMDRSAVTVGGRFEPLGTAPGCDEPEREALSGIVRTRPVWLAAGTSPDESDIVDAAMRSAIRLSHRLLLILAPRDARDGPEIAARFAAAGWRTACRSREEDPGEEIQVYVADTDDDPGLWYRMAAVTYLGESLTTRGTEVDPFAPARLGSAVIHGPAPALHVERLERLTRARASRQVMTGAELGEALLELLSPERAALLARRAWEETTRGADLMAEAEAIILATIDARPAP